jgi:hypothetical protein
MAPPRGHPKWGGKKKGTRNINSRVRERERMLQAAIAAALTPEQVAELSPLEVMRTVMRRRIQAGDEAGALAAAAVAAPYVHARLSMSDVRVQHSTADRSDTEIAREIEALRRRVEAARAAETPLIEARALPAAEMPLPPAAADEDRQVVRIPQRQHVDPVAAEPGANSGAEPECEGNEGG